MNRSLLKADGKCVRLYNKLGEHKLSLLPCAEDRHRDVCVVDLCLPNGKVLYCGVDLHLANMLVVNLGLEPIENQQDAHETFSHSMMVGLGAPADVFVAVAPNFQLTGPHDAVRKAMLEDSLNDVDKPILKTFQDVAENCPIQANTKRTIEDE